PILVQLVQVDETRLAKREASDLPFRSACSWVIPRPDDQIVPFLCRGGSIPHMLFVEFESSRLVCIVLTCKREDRNVDPPILFRAWDHCIPVGIWNWMLQPLLKDGGCVSDCLVSLALGPMAEIVFSEFFDTASIVSTG